LWYINIPASIYDCISSPIVIDAQFTELNNVIKIYIKILLHGKSSIAEVFKNLSRYRSENNFVGLE